MPASPRIQTLILVVGIVIVIGIWVGGSLFQQKEEVKTKLSDETEFVTFNTSTGAYSISKRFLAYTEMCNPYKDSNDTITYFNAIQRSLGVFNGAVISVNRTIIVFPTNTSIPPWSAWLIKIRLADPISLPDGKLAYEGEVAVHRITNDVKPYRLIE